MAELENSSDEASVTDPRAYYCEAVPRKQFEASSWGEANIGCSRRGVELVEGGVVCRMHLPENKRYGWNPRREWQRP